MKIQPTRDEFHRHAAEHTVVPVWTELLADLARTRAEANVAATELARLEAAAAKS